MKKIEKPSDETLDLLNLFQGRGLLILFLAVIPLLAQNWIASFAATRMIAHTTLRTMNEPDDAHIEKAFASARESTGAEAMLARDDEAKGQTRDSTLTVTGKSSREAIVNLTTMITAMQRTFIQAGWGELYDIGNANSATFVPDDRTRTVHRICIGSALLILVMGALVMLKQWRRANLPPGAGWAFLAMAGGAILYFLGPVALIPGLPIFAIALVVILTRRIHRAADWAQGTARIAQSDVAVQRHRFEGEATNVKNVAALAYEFNVGPQVIQGSRISLGFTPADVVDETLKRYPVGAKVPVFFDPKNPSDCVLERNPPTSMGCIWAGVVFGLLVYFGAIAYVWTGGFGVSLTDKFDEAFPQLHHPVLTLGMALLALLCFSSATWNKLNPRPEIAWRQTIGKIVSSETEPYVAPSGRTSRPVIEFSYLVDGHEYHNTNKYGDSDPKTYPVNSEITVFFDPKNPIDSALEKPAPMQIDGRHSFFVGVVALAISLFAFFH